METIDPSDPRWFARVVKAYTPRMLAAARAYEREGFIEAEEVVQAAWIKVMKPPHLDRVLELLQRKDAEGRDGLVAWLVTVTKNAGRDLVKRAPQRREISYNADSLGSAGASEDVPDLEDAERECVWNAVDALPRLQRRVVRLRVIEGMSLREASEVTGKSLSTVKTSWYRALAALRRELFPELIFRLGGGDGARSAAPGSDEMGRHDES